MAANPSEEADQRCPYRVISMDWHLRMSTMRLTAPNRAERAVNFMIAAKEGAEKWGREVEAGHPGAGRVRTLGK
jgi:hypothetical protein